MIIKIPQPDLVVKDEEIFEIHQNKFKVIHTPGHTLQHVNYFILEHNIFFLGILYLVWVVVECLKEHLKFSGKAYLKSNNSPEDTTIYCGHEYTLSNVLNLH
jgi:hydroxyacylglutathione hydrolase